MTDYEIYQTQKNFITETLAQLRESLPAEEKPLMHSVVSTHFHTAPEAAQDTWHKLFGCLVHNFKDVDGVHANTVGIYNSRYGEFKKRWHS